MHQVTPTGRLVEIDNHLDSFDNNRRRRDPEDVTDSEDLEQLDDDSNNDSDLGSDHTFPNIIN